MRAMLAQVSPDEQLALMNPKEQFFLYLDRPVVNFGHGRWVEGPLEGYDAARWLGAAPGRVLLVPGSRLSPCFVHSAKKAVGVSAGEEWSLVQGSADAACAARGDINRAIRYVPPRLRTES